MANSSSILAIAQTDALNLGAMTGKQALVRIRNYLDAVIGGNKRADSIKVIPDGAALVNATGKLTLSSASGAVGGTIDGTLVTATASGGDTNSAALIAAAINASAAMKGKVTASSSAAVVTVTAAVPGVIGNCISLVASGTGVTASGAKLGTGTGTAGTGGDAASTAIFTITL